MTSPEVLVASVFPRGEPSGEPALVALAPDTLEVLGYREFPRSDFIANPIDGRSGAIRQARGIAGKGDRLFVSLFNSVGEYRVIDPSRLSLAFERHFSSTAAADLHGISVTGGNLAAASTGGDCVLVWDIESSACHNVGVGGIAPPDRDIRFPCQPGGTSGTSWRDALPGRNHLNDVALLEDGFVSCSLGRIALRVGGKERVLAECPDALFHDAQLLGDGEVIATDGARGEMVFIDLRSGRREGIAISDPDRWFVRGTGVAGDHAYVLRSQVVENRQTLIGANGRPRRWGATLGVSVLELRSRRLVADGVVTLPDAPAGSVAYQPMAWPPGV